MEFTFEDFFFFLGNAVIFFNMYKGDIQNLPSKDVLTCNFCILLSSAR